MRSPAAAIAWEFRRRHRWGLLALLVYFTALAAIKVLRSTPLTFADDLTFALAVAVPLTSTFLYFLSVFSYGLSGDIGARQSMYPARLFTLPVTTGALAGWPMLYGTVAAAILWLATRFLAAWPPKAEVPRIWPALLGASLMAWTQALTWMPYPLRNLRVIVTVAWLMTIDAIVMVALEFKPGEPVMLALLAPHVPLAYLVARRAVGRARCGNGLQPVPGRAKARPYRGRTGSFRSVARAQRWFEWRLHGRSLPGLVAILLPFQLAMLFVFHDTPVIVFETLFSVLITPALMATFVAATVGSPSTAFLATRPMTDAALIAAKLKVALRSTFAAYVLVLAATPIALRLSGTEAMVRGWAHWLVEAAGVPRAIAIALLALAALFASTWKQLVQSLYIGMSGREWLVKTSVFATLVLVAVFVPLAHWAFTSKPVFTALWDAFPWILAALVCLKLSAASWIAVRLHQQRLLGQRALLLGAILWNLGVFALYGLLCWIVPELLIRHYLFALMAILAVPLTRLAAAPLALAWSRHR